MSSVEPTELNTPDPVILEAPVTAPEPEPHVFDPYTEWPPESWPVSE